MNDNRYALLNALLFTLLVSIIMLAPLYVYLIYSKTFVEIQNEIELKAHATTVIRAMEAFDEANEPAFDYPRFAQVQSGLYDLQFKPIFTLIESPLRYQSEGYHIDGGYAYYVLSLPKGRYFGAEYLIVGNTLSYAEVYQKTLIILLLIVLMLFTLSFLFLNRFALPFKKLNARLDKFMKDSMHEINTPLSIINVNIDLYNRKYEPNKYLQRIRAAAKTLSSIYDDMDYLIKNSRLSFQSEPIALDAFLKERVAYFDEVAAMKEIALEVTHCHEVHIRFNPTQLQRIIDNNLSNAIKYSHPQSRVEVSLRRMDDGCEMRFRDYGVGMKHPEQIFERYYRESDRVGGFGIGLNIVKSIIDSHDIRLHVSSVLGEGSEFCYIFPKALMIR